MFNLLVTAKEGAWESGKYEFDGSRVLKSFTDDDLKQRLGSLDAAAITQLQSFPTLFAYEGRWDTPAETARVGWITRIRVRGPRVLIDFEMSAEAAPIPAATLKALAWELDIQDWEISHTHWAVKDAELLPILLREKAVPAKALGAAEERARLAATTGDSIIGTLIQPRVFRLPQEPVQSDLVAVMMPFDGAFSPVYRAVQEACSHLGLECKRADEIFNEEVLIQDIFSLIFRSRAVISDLTGRNPNVFYEVGIAHTLGKIVIPIVQSTEHVPFDIRHHRFIQYLNNGEGLALLMSSLESRLKNVFTDR